MNDPNEISAPLLEVYAADLRGKAYLGPTPPNEPTSSTSRAHVVPPDLWESHKQLTEALELERAKTAGWSERLAAVEAENLELKDQLALTRRAHWRMRDGLVKAMMRLSEIL